MNNDVQPYHVSGWVTIRFESHVLVHPVGEYATATGADDALARVEHWLGTQHAGADFSWDGVPIIKPVAPDEMMRAMGALPLPGFEGDGDGYQD